MKIDKRTYSVLDTLWIPFKITPLCMSLQMLLVVVHAIVPTAVLALVTAYFVDTAIRIFEGGTVVYSIYLPLGLLLTVVGISSVLDSLLQVIESRIRFSLERNFMPAILEVQASLAYKHIEDADSWELIKLVSDEMTETFQDGIRSYGVVIRSVVAILAISGLILTQVWWAALIIVFFSIPLLGVSLWAGKKNYAAKVEALKYERRYSYYSEEILTSREAVEERTLFGYADDVTRRFYEHFEKARDIQLKVLLKTRIAMKITSISLALITLVTAFTFINPVISGVVSPGMFMGIIVALFGMVETIGWKLQDAAKNIAESKEYMNDLTTLVEFDRTKGAIDLPNEHPIKFESLEFRNVRFKYPSGNEYILDGLSFKLDGGKHYAFVGANGAGKTTITKLLTRLYDDYEGEILINGNELRTYATSTIKAIFSVVYQDFARYQISMADNIALGDVTREIGKQQILEIVSKVELDDTIGKLPEGVYTTLGKISDSGVDISGGQWQKIAVARSLLSHSPVKILDEPTSSLDPIAESQIYKKFEELMRGKTTIFISHRLGSTKLADEILVIDKGNVVERGTHSTLIKENGLYASMFEAQRKWYE